MDVKLVDSELKVMNVLWREGDATALIPKEEVQILETEALLDKIFDGSADKLFATLLGRKKLSKEEIGNLRKMVEELK